MPGFVGEAGLFADAGVKLPPGVGMPSPAAVAGALIAAVERNRAEVDVAPVGLRVGAKIAGVAPGLAASAIRLARGERIASQLAEGQRDKR
jgi:hypothetical protein